MEDIGSAATEVVQKDRPLSVLLVAMVDSIHVAKWIELYRNSNTSFVLLPSGPNRRVHPRIEAAVRGELPGVSVRIEPPFLAWAGLPMQILDALFRHKVRGFFLKRVFDHHQFDLVHVQELQHAGYTALAAFRKTPPRLLYVSNWGSDIFWFMRSRTHRRRIKALLAMATHYSAECHRDVKIAADMGFSGVVLPVIPNAGGLPIIEIEKLAHPPSQRGVVLVKGYTGFVGQAISALRAVRDVRDILSEFEVVVYSASRKARLYGAYLRMRYKINLRLLPPGVDHGTMLELFRSARVYVGVSLSDGISTSLLEAMATGCFPIQTDTSCGNEWLSEQSGLLVAPNDHSGLVSAIRQAITNDALVDRAALENRATIIERATSDTISKSARGSYNQIISSD